MKKQSTFIAISAILLAVVIGGSSYALFFQVNTNSRNQVIETGNLEISYGNGSQAISSHELVPMTDMEAMDSAINNNSLVSTIYISNDGSLPASYSIRIGNDLTAYDARSNKQAGDELLDHQYIKLAVYQIVGDVPNLVVGPKNLNEFAFSDSAQTLRTITGGKLDVKNSSGDSSATYAIKIWLDDTAPTSIAGKYIYLKVDTVSTVDEAKALDNN